MDVSVAGECIETVRSRTGVVIPVYLPDGIDMEIGAALLRDTVGSFCAQTTAPETVCLSVDGAACGADVAREIADVFGALICVAEINSGKLSAAANGVRTLLGSGDLSYVAIVDQDGIPVYQSHHDPYELTLLRRWNFDVSKKGCAAKEQQMQIARR